MVECVSACGMNKIDVVPMYQLKYTVQSRGRLAHVCASRSIDAEKRVILDECHLIKKTNGTSFRAVRMLLATVPCYFLSY